MTHLEDDVPENQVARVRLYAAGLRAGWVRAMHPAKFRSGRWARILMCDRREDGRPTWLVAWPDDVTDVWVADDTVAEYEFSTCPPGA